MDPQTRAMYAAGHSSTEDSIADLMEVYGADGYEENEMTGELQLLKDGEPVGFPWERRR